MGNMSDAPMRDIKFRAWIVDEMLYDFIVWQPNGTGLKDGCRLNQAIKRFQDEEDFVLLQYTGLKDKNGKDIYEGDIVKRPSAILPLEVIWDVQQSRYMNKPIGCKHLITRMDMMDEYEIIGNIYENGDLLK